MILRKAPSTLGCWELSHLFLSVSPTPFFPSLQTGPSRALEEVGGVGAGERADGLGIYPGSSLRHPPSSHRLPTTSKYLEKIILDLQHLPGQLSNAAEGHSWDAVDNGQVNQPTEEGKKEKKKEKLVPSAMLRSRDPPPLHRGISSPPSPVPFPVPPAGSSSILPSPWGSSAAGQGRNTV